MTKVSLKNSLNLKSEFLDLKIMKIKFQALLHLRFNLRFEIWDFTIRQSSLYFFFSRYKIDPNYT